MYSIIFQVLGCSSKVYGESSYVEGHNIFRSWILSYDCHFVVTVYLSVPEQEL